ncbi:rhomboid family intramembrane serine protease [Kaarinaea lacus]
MLFFPYKVDINLTRWPVFTLLVCALCIFIYYQQYKNQLVINKAALSYCKKNKDKLFGVVVEKITGANNQRNCASLLVSLHFNNKPEIKIDDLSHDYHVFDSLNFAQGRALVVEVLTEQYHRFQKNVPKPLTTQLMYEPRSFSIQNMLTAAVAHGSWLHLVGNLFFFYAFAASAEIIVGSFAFLVIVLALAVGTNLAYSVVVFSDLAALPTLGLSGVVMGMIGLFVFMIPTARIRCFFWLLVFVRILRIPAWILALWYVGWDVFQLYSQTATSNVNLVAHVSGAAIGLLIGIIFYRNKRPSITGSKRLRKPT